MCDQYSRALLRAAVSEILRKEGFSHAQLSSLQTLTDAIEHFYSKIAAGALSLSRQHFKETQEVLLVDVIEALRELAFTQRDLKEYRVDLDDDAQPFPICFPKFPIKRERENETSNISSHKGGASSSFQTTTHYSTTTRTSPMPPTPLATTTTTPFGSEISSYGISQAPNGPPRLPVSSQQPISHPQQPPRKQPRISYITTPNNPHIPPWLPSFPHHRTYKTTDVIDVPTPSETNSKALHAKRKRQAESALAKVQPQCIANYDLIRSMGTYVPNSETLDATTSVSSLVPANTQNPYLRPTKTSAQYFSGEGQPSQTSIEKKDLIPFLKYGEDPVTALERIEQLKPVNLRETVEDSGRVKKVIKTNTILTNSKVLKKKDK